MNTFTDPKINTWINENPEGFLHGLRDTSTARKWCREFIEQECTMNGCNSILEIGVGGLNERIALDEFLTRRKDVKYTGTDWNEAFIEQAFEKFPDGDWGQYDIVKGDDDCELQIPDHDIVYSQHVLEHCGGLTPALANMLALTKCTLLNIFFLPLRPNEDLQNWSQYPRYHNTYCFQHVQKVCEYHGFDARFEEFTNAVDPKRETVLIATKI
jgi:hypothetical protein